MIITKGTYDAIVEALNMSDAYISYVREHDLPLHYEANGSPCASVAVANATQLLQVDVVTYDQSV